MIIQKNIDTIKNYIHNGYIRIEIENYDHNNFYIISKDNAPTLSNAKWVYKYDLPLATGSGSNPFTFTKNITIDENGKYRVQVYGLTNVSYKVNDTTWKLRPSQTIELKINGKSYGKLSNNAMDEFTRFYDFGVVGLKEGSHTFQLVCGNYVHVAFIVIKKINILTGSTDNDGDFYIKSCQVDQTNVNEPSNAEFVILNDTKFIEPSITDYTKSGLIFDYLDVVNIWMGTDKTNQKHVFGGYILENEVSEDQLTIRIKCESRLYDFKKTQILKELVIGAAVTENTNISAKVNNIYDGIKYVLDSIETPINTSNLQEIVKDAIIPKDTIRYDLSNSLYAKNIIVSKMNKKIVTNKQKGTVLELQNQHPKNTTQYATIFDYRKHVKNKKPVRISTSNDIKTFFIEYGLGSATKKSETVTKIVTVRKRLKSGKIKTRKKKKKVKIVYDGYNKDQTLLAWIKITYKTSQGTTHTKNINFTSNTTNNVIGIIKPQIDNDFWSRGEIDILTPLTQAHPTSTYFDILKVTLETKTPAEDLYNPKNKESKQQYKLLFKGIGFKKGTPITPEIIQGNGKTPLEVLNNLCKKLKLIYYFRYDKERRKDELFFEPLGSQLLTSEVKEGYNLLELSNLKYSPSETLKNNIIKIYKDSNNKNHAVNQCDLECIAHFGSHTEYEEIQDTVGEYYASMEALNDLNEKYLPRWTYTVQLFGIIHAQCGRQIYANFKDEKLDDIKIIKSYKYEYDSSGKITTTLGLDYEDKEMNAKNYIKDIKKVLKKKAQLTGGAYFSESIDLEE